MSQRHLRLVLGAILFCAPLVVAQSTSTTPPRPAPTCAGTVTMVRISEVKPGKMDDFMAAVAANLAWYRNNGVTTNKIYAARILETNPDTKERHYSDTRVMTFHVNPPQNPKLPRNDDAWKAFVQKYNDSSDMKTEYYTCSTTPIS